MVVTEGCLPQGWCSEIPRSQETSAHKGKCTEAIAPGAQNAGAGRSPMNGVASGHWPTAIGGWSVDGCIDLTRIRFVRSQSFKNMPALALIGRLLPGDRGSHAPRELERGTGIRVRTKRPSRGDPFLEEEAL